MIFEFSTSDLSFLTNEELLQEFNIYHNPSWIMIKGKNHLQYPKNILTVENLTSFSRNDFQNKDVFIFYLGGFSNNIKFEFLKTLYSYYPDSHYYHFGDIDCGVFKIWKNLIERTSIPFKTLSMDLNTLMTHSQFCKELTVNDY